MWRGKRVAVIFPTYNEKESIRAATLDFFSTGVVDEIIVINNNAAPGTSEELVGTSAREIFETKQGYGHALLCGVDHCDADIVIFAEPDGTFVGRDVFKLLTYSDDKPVIFGTRTSRDFVWSGANMGRFLRWGNWAVAKMTEVLFNTTALTDVGCTLRLFTREALKRIRPQLTIGGSHFGPQLLMEAIAHRIPFVEIPVNYRERVGMSMVTGNLWKAFCLGIRMILLIWAYRLGFYGSERHRWTAEAETKYGEAGKQPIELVVPVGGESLHLCPSRVAGTSTESLPQQHEQPHRKAA
ncbi:MAG: glycosyltransferase family 2 protein [Planctomycetes bacterium]|nr:glycosyltransferase family 2 protein [Planctomycetota bacterium]